MSSENVESVRFDLVWDLRDPIASIDRKPIKYANEGSAVYRITFIENGKRCANVGETGKGLGERLRKHIALHPPRFTPQSRMRAAFEQGQDLVVETLNKEASRVLVGSSSRMLRLDDQEERLMIEAMEQWRLRNNGVEVINIPKKLRANYVRRPV